MTSPMLLSRINWAASATVASASMTSGHEFITSRTLLFILASSLRISAAIQLAYVDLIGHDRIRRNLVGIDHGRHNFRGPNPDAPTVADLHLAALIDGAADLVGLKLVGVDDIRAHHVSPDLLGLQRLRRGWDSRWGEDTRHRWRVNANVIGRGDHAGSRHDG